MNAILAIDAAWTANQPSGVALLTDTDSRWQCHGLAPSYLQFDKLADGIPIEWAQARNGSVPNLRRS